MARRTALLLAAAAGCFWLTLAPAAVIDLSPKRKAPVGDYNLRLGSLRVAFSGTMETGYDDNITSAPASGPAVIYSDWYTKPGMNASINWPLTTYVGISSGIGVSYRYYATYPQFNDLNITSDTGGLSARADVTLRLGQTGDLVLSESLSRSLDTLELATTPGRNTTGSSGENYTRTQHELALQYNVDLNKYDRLSLRYSHGNTWVTPAEYQYEDHQSDLFDSVLLHTLTKSLRLGPYFTTEYTYYSKPNPVTQLMRNDSLSNRFGLAAVLVHGAAFSADARLGWEMVQYDNTNPVPTATSSSGTTATLTVNYMSSIFTQHTVTMSLGSRQTGMAESSNFGDDLQCSYALGYLLTRDVTLRTDIAYLNRRDSESGGNTTVIRWGFGPSRELGRDTSISIRYQCSTTTTDQGLNDTAQNLFTVTLTHHF